MDVQGVGIRFGYLSSLCLVTLVTLISLPPTLARYDLTTSDVATMYISAI